MTATDFRLGIQNMGIPQKPEPAKMTDSGLGIQNMGIPQKLEPAKMTDSGLGIQNMGIPQKPEPAKMMTTGEPEVKPSSSSIQVVHGAGSEPGRGLVSKPNPMPKPNQNQLGTGPEEERPSKWIHFGPTYGDDTEVNQKAKDSAWQHIVKKSDGKESEYLRSIAKIEKAAKDSYESSIMDELNRAPNKFVQMMVKDGCFFLQLAFHILGAGRLLGHKPHNPYFGVDSDSSSWIPAMFFVGNQIPYVVINSLMKQSFFKEVINEGRWHHLRSEEDLVKLALYQTVVEPQLMISATGPKEKRAEPPPFNVLEALRSLLLGSKHKNPISPEMRAFQDLETGVDDSRTKFPSAGELKNSGITLKKAERGITTNIRFKSRFLYAHLYVPPLTIDTHTKDLLTSLVKLEQLVSESNREVTAYIRFMRDLSPTYKDFKILKDEGIIRVTDDKLMSNMIHVLHKLVPTTNSNLTQNFRNIKRGVEGYKGPPWALIGFIISTFTVIQTILACFVYGFPRN